MRVNRRVARIVLVVLGAGSTLGVVHGVPAAAAEPPVSSRVDGFVVVNDAGFGGTVEDTANSGGDGDNDLGRGGTNFGFDCYPEDDGVGKGTVCSGLDAAPDAQCVANLSQGSSVGITADCSVSGE